MRARGVLRKPGLSPDYVKKTTGAPSQFAKKIMSWGGCLIFGSACGALMTGTVVCDAYEHMLSTGACTLPVAPAGPMLPLSYRYAGSKKTRVG